MSLAGEPMPETRGRAVRLLRRIAVAVAGGTVLLIGVVLIFLPAPAILVIPLGLGILALEFAWARIWLAKFRATFSRRKKADTGRPDLPPRA